MAERLMTCGSGRGQELCNLLRKELNVPEHVLSFSVSFSVNDLIRVQCEYLPQEAVRDGER